MSDILEIHNISKSFPGVKALKEVSFNVKKGEVHALVGENGAGKSTLMKILSGVYAPTSGEIRLNGEKTEFKNPKEAQEKGVSIIHQEFSLIPSLNAIDNIFLGNEIRQSTGFLDKKKMRQKAKASLQRLNAEIDLNKPVDQLSIANQQFIEIAKAISAQTKILIFDEPTASLTGNEVDNLFKLIASLKESGVTIIYISHHLDEIIEICDTLTCLKDGVWTGTKKVADVNKQQIINMMVGRSIENAFPERPLFTNYDKSNLLLSIKNLENENVTGINFDLYKGEILGISGLVGAGRTETVRALIGADKADKKEVYMDDKRISINNPTDALSYGMCLIPESRKTQGLILDMNIKNNISLPIMSKITDTFGLIKSKKEHQIIEASIKELLIKTPSSNQRVKNLSGGNQQKVVLAKWLNTDARIIIFDEPTRGIDIGAKEEIYKLMRRLADNGISIIMISSELPEVLGMSDRVLVMHKGEIKKELKASEASENRVMYFATGGLDGEE